MRKRLKFNRYNILHSTDCTNTERGGGGGEGNRLGNSSARRDAGVTVNDKLSMSQQRHIVVKIASVTLRYRTRSKDFET